MSCPVRPIQDRIICRPVAQEYQLASGIVVPGVASVSDEAEIVAVGPGRLLDDGTRQPMRVMAGERLIFPSTRGQLFAVQGVQYIVLNEQHALAYVAADGQLRALNDYLVAEQLTRRKQIGSIYMPDTIDDRDEADVLLVGLGKWGAEAPKLSAGDRVLYNKRMGLHFCWVPPGGDPLRDGRELVAFREENVYCVVERGVEIISLDYDHARNSERAEDLRYMEAAAE